MSDVQRLFELGVHQHQAGNLTSASKCYASVLQAKPDHADAWHLSGVLSHQAGRSSAGIRNIHRAIELNPVNPEYFSNAAVILIAQSRYNDAIRATETALKLQPDFQAANVQKGIALVNLNRVDEAIVLLEQAYKADFCSSAVLTEMGLAAIYAGDFSRAISCLETSIEFEPESATPYFFLSRLVKNNKYKFASHQVAALEARLAASSSNSQQKARLNFTLGNHFHSQDDFSKAFEHYKTGNESTLEYLSNQTQYDIESWEQRVGVLTEFFTPQVIEKFKDAGSDSNQPIFIVGSPRSGSTLTEKILSAHSDVFSAGELTKLDQIIGSRFGSEQPLTLQSLSLMDANWINSAAEQYLDHINTLTARDKRVIDKMPGNIVHLGFIALMFPNAKVVICNRDPRDVAISNFDILFDSNNLQIRTSSMSSIAEYLVQQNRLVRHWKKVIPDQAFDLYYESMTDDPRLEISKLLSHCDLEWSDDCLYFHTKKSVVRTASDAQVRNPINRNSVGRWRNYEDKMGDFCKIAAGEIAEYESMLSSIRRTKAIQGSHGSA